jgi:hypothetical protein
MMQQNHKNIFVFPFFIAYFFLKNQDLFLELGLA